MNVGFCRLDCGDSITECWLCGYRRNGIGDGVSFFENRRRDPIRPEVIEPMYPQPDDYYGQSAYATQPVRQMINFKYSKEVRWAAQQKLDELQEKQKYGKGLTEEDVSMKLVLHEVLNEVVV